MDNVKQKILDFLAVHHNIHLATVNADGKPSVATVAYVNDKKTAYIVTSSSTRKAQNIAKNPNVAFASDFEMTGMNDIRDVQMQGKAEILTIKTEIDKAFARMLDRFPQMAALSGMPGLIVIKIIFTEGYFIDYSVAFGHRDKAVY